MHKKFLIFILFIILFQTSKAQNEFITIWKPNIQNPTNINAPTAAGINQIWFPGIGDNYTITWEEIGFPQHTGTMNNVTSASQVLIDFGFSLNPDPVNAAFRVKASNGAGIFRQIRFSVPHITSSNGNIFVTWDLYGNTDRITEIEQWGNIQWSSMGSAFANCKLLQLTAMDSPNLSNVTDASFMFANTDSFTGHSSMSSWNTSGVKDFRYMFGFTPYSSIPANNTFDAPVGSWNTSSAEDMSYMFNERRAFNQNLNSWNTSKVKDMRYMFANCLAFNQPLDNWDTSKVTDMSFMFHLIPNFNQPIGNWDTSNVTDISHMFHAVAAFNQPLNSWDVSKVTNMSNTFANATHFNQPLDSWNTSQVTNMLALFWLASDFNQSLQNWNLSSLNLAIAMISLTGIDCENYSRTLSGWEDNTNTPDNINLGALAPLMYSTDVINKRNILISKNWVMNGDVTGECRLGTSEQTLHNQPSIYPNPATDFIYIKNIKGLSSYKIFDTSGRIALQGLLNGENINVSSLVKGNYILQVISKEKTYSLKLIKK